jgi:hypothetical protein
MTTVPSVSFTPTFEHADLIDNVDLVEAGGPNGLNKRLNAIESDFHQMSDVVARIGTVLDRLNLTGPQRLSIPVTLTEVSAEWRYDEIGALRALARNGKALLNVNLPSPATLVSFRAVGFADAAPASLSIGLFRAPFANSFAVPEKLAEVTVNSGAAFDRTVPVDDTHALVEPASFRYFITAVAQSLPSDPSSALAALQIVYSAG